MKPLIRVMLVDDEILALRHIRNMVPWEQCGYEIVCEYTHPQKALDNLAKHRPQVVIADIKMPVMDGIALSSKLLAADDKLKIILLTSYKEFEYAKQALKLGIFDYWVKHELNADFLTGELTRLRQEIVTYMRNHDMLRRQAWLELIQGGTLSDVNRSVLKALLSRDESNLSMMLLRLDSAYPLVSASGWGGNGIPAVDEDKVRDVVQAVQDPDLDLPVQVVDTISLNKGTWCVITRSDSVLSRHRYWEHVRSFASGIQLRMKEQTGETISITASGQWAAIDQLPSLYSTLHRLMQCVVFFGRNRFLSVEEHGHLPSRSDVDIKQVVLAVREAAEAGDDDQTLEAVQSAFDKVSAAFDRDALEKLRDALTQLLEELRAEHGLPAFMNFYTSHSPSSSSEGLGTVAELHAELHTAADLCMWMTDAFKSTLRELQSEHAYSRKTRHTIEYMRKHYAEDITIETLAEEVGVSGEHLRHLFKEETGQTMLEYLTNIRMQRAKQLLTEGQYKIYEVAEMVGYRSGQYFSQVFRKCTGTGPLEYAERKGKRSL